ncbi:MAG: TolC family protein [gamma proteobacterium symbiont of Taylorina sp.]|nr:TolC family protein [gamma proteobacterium symbiont of Taylorina sp.]
MRAISQISVRAISQIRVRASNQTWKLLCLLLLFSIQINAAEPLPEPLNLEYALSRAVYVESSEMMTYSAQRQIALAEQELAASQSGIFAEINARLRYVDPSPIVPASETNDSKISLDISKRLYDFGYSGAIIAASEENLASVDALYADMISKRTIMILQAYFNILLADVIFDYSNEAMAVDYVTLDKIRSRFELGQISDIELLSIENKYRVTRRERNNALSVQRISRNRLSQLISPGQLSTDLEKPDFNNFQALSSNRELKDFEQLYQTAYKQNSRLISHQHKLASARHKVSAFQAEKYPVISAHLQAADYARDLGSSDEFRAGIEFKVPLYQSGQENARIRRATGRIIQLEAENISIKQELEQQILELWLKISELKQQFSGTVSDLDLVLDHRELYLDRSRALYELEVTSDLGDAMVELTQAQLFNMQTVFDLAIAWAKLDALLGNPMNYTEQNSNEQNDYK